MVADAYAQHLAALVDAGAVPEALVDAAVRNVLRLKLALGLFEHPYVDPALADQLILREDLRALALQVAQESMVLVKNAGGLLPLAPSGQRIALIGPLADSRQDLLGTWVLNGRAEDVESVRDGLRACWAIRSPPMFRAARSRAIKGWICRRLWRRPRLPM